MDFYAQQIGARLEDVTSFAKYLGGSSSNTAFGCARLGLKAALVSRIGDISQTHSGRLGQIAGVYGADAAGAENCDFDHERPRFDCGAARTDG